MTLRNQFKGPFCAQVRTMTEAQVEALMKQAETATPVSFDHIDLRMHKASDERGFLKVEIVYENHCVDIFGDADLEDQYDALIDLLSSCEVRGTRGNRAVLISGAEHREDEEEVVITAWIGRNVWYNKHRMTAGFPGNADQIDDVLADIERRMNSVSAGDLSYGFVEVRIPEEGGVTREEIQEAVAELKGRIAIAEAALARHDVNPQSAFTHLTDAVETWLEDNDELILRD